MNCQVFLLSDGPELMCPNNYTALEGAPYNLTCIVEGYPKPEIIWSKDGEEVELPENLTRRDSGQYLITASSNLSSVNLTVEINVICKLILNIYYQHESWVKMSSAFSLTYIVLIFVSRPTITDSWAWRLWSWRWFHCVAEVLLRGKPTTKIFLELLPDCQCDRGKWRWSVPSAHPQCYCIQHGLLHMSCLEWQRKCL